MKTKEENEIASNSNINASSSSYCKDNIENEQVDDSTLRVTILSNSLQGHPYSYLIMRQAATNLYGSNLGITYNKLYIRSRPSNDEQIEQLESENVEWFDYPLNAEVIQEGDYYPQAGIGQDDIPWFYAMVEPNYVFPAGIQTEILEYAYVPEDLALEYEAFRITGNAAIYLNDCRTAVLQYPPLPCNDPNDPNCWPSPGGGGGVPDPTKSPAGNIRVEDTQLPGALGNNLFPVRQVRVVCKRFLKIVTTYTDDNGNFSVAKKFHNKVHVIVKFKNNNLTTRGIRGASFWQMWFPIKYSIGKFSGDLRNITYTFTQGSNTHTVQTRNWWAAQLMNSYLEYNEMARLEHTGELPLGLKVVLSAWGRQGGTGSTPMNRHRATPMIPNPDYVGIFLADPRIPSRFLLYNWALNGIFLSRTDMTLGYDTYLPSPSDKVKELIYHEFTHATHFNKVGETWYGGLTTAELYTTAKWGLASNNAPYGLGDDGNSSQIIALGESWAEHIGQYFTDLRYGLNSSSEYAQGNSYFNNSPVNGLSSHFNLLEDYNPNLLSDNTKWIPYGLYYDLFDSRNEVVNPIHDNYSGITNQQMFNAFETDINSLPLFRQRLIQQTGANATSINQLFNEYHY